MKQSQQTSSVKVEKLDDMGIFQVENLTITIANRDKELFLRDPEGFIKKLIAAKETVNGLIIGASLLERMKQRVKKGSGSTATTTSTWHCISPPKMKSRRIVVILK